MSNKEDNFKEQFKQALISTAKVISEDYKLDIKKIDKNLKSKKIDFFDVTNLSNKNDFVRLRAETDSGALKKKFSNKEIFDKNLPNNPSCKSLYNIAEKIRYEVLGGKMLKGVKKNITQAHWRMRTGEQTYTNDKKLIKTLKLTETKINRKGKKVWLLFDGRKMSFINGYLMGTPYKECHAPVRAYVDYILKEQLKNDN